jgi:hypothetical protein
MKCNPRNQKAMNYPCDLQKSALGLNGLNHGDRRKGLEIIAGQVLIDDDDDDDVDVDVDVT